MMLRLLQWLLRLTFIVALAVWIAGGVAMTVFSGKHERDTKKEAMTHGLREN